MKPGNKKSTAGQRDRFHISDKNKIPNPGKLIEMPAASESASGIGLLLPYLRIAKYLARENFEAVLFKAAELAPGRLSAPLKRLEKELRDNTKIRAEVNGLISDNIINQKTYNSLCLFLLTIILSKDNRAINYIDHSKFASDIFGLEIQKINSLSPIDVPRQTSLVAQGSDESKKMMFCFDSQEPGLKAMADKLMKSDKEFKNLWVLIVSSYDLMRERRRVSNARKWPRGFFLCLEEIQRKAEKLDPDLYSKFCGSAPRPAQSPARIKSLAAHVLENIPVGENKNHYKLKFRINESFKFDILPGQFIMLSTAVDALQDAPARGPVKLAAMKNRPQWIEPKPYLKRPFGIHRAFYKHFSGDKSYLQKCELPSQLAAVLHTVFPNEFEIFYKVLASGIGTRELSKIKRGNEIQILGPLGKGAVIGDLRDEGFDEIHVIGGGVGMAPLIFIVQALRYYSYKVKAFIGTEKLGMLKYKLKQAEDGLAETFTDNDPTLYIDDLLEVGIDSSNIYVSSGEAEICCKKIPRGNLYSGFASDQYNNYLLNAGSKKKILAFACGPYGMMKALASITERYGIPLKVLMEKRMACGMGVCLSCVCETKTPGNTVSTYARVCTDGPIFDASEIVWK